MLKILIKAVSNDSHLAARKMSNYACWKKLANNCETAAHGAATFQPQRSWWEEKILKAEAEPGSLRVLPLQVHGAVLFTSRVFNL